MSYRTHPSIHPDLLEVFTKNMYTYTILTGAANLVPVLVPLPIMLYPFHQHCENGYEEASLKLSLLAARRIDASLREDDAEAADTEADTGVFGGEEEQPLSSGSSLSAPEKTSSGTAAAAAAASPSVEESKGVSNSTSIDGNRAASPSALLNMGPSARRRRSTMAIGPRHDDNNINNNHANNSIPLEPPIIVDYFQMSAYAQPSLTEGPQQAEDHYNQQQGGGSDSNDNSPRPISLTASAHAALAKRLKTTGGELDFTEEIREPLNPASQFGPLTPVLTGGSRPITPKLSPQRTSSKGSDDKV